MVNLIAGAHHDRERVACGKWAYQIGGSMARGTKHISEALERRHTHALNLLIDGTKKARGIDQSTICKVARILSPFGR